MRKILVPVLVLFLMLGILPGSGGVGTAAGADLTVSPNPTASVETLTVEKAIDLALTNRTDVLLASLNLQAASLSSDIVWDTASEALQSGEIDHTGQYTPAAAVATDQVITSDFNLESAQKNYETQKDSVKFSVYSKYYAVVNALDNNDAQRLANEQAGQKLKIAQLRYLLGMDNKATLYTAQQQTVSAQSNYTLAQQVLDQKYIALLDYIGLNRTTRPDLVRELTYKPVVIANPENKFAEIVNGSPSVWLAKRSLVVSEQTANFSVGLQGDLTAVNLEKADISVITTRDAMLQTTRSLYYNILSVEQSYATAVGTAKAADENLRVAKLMYEVGMGIKTDVTAAEIAANSAHQTLDSLSYQHAILVMALEQPWAYGGAAASGN